MPFADLCALTTRLCASIRATRYKALPPNHRSPSQPHCDRRFGFAGGARTPRPLANPLLSSTPTGSWVGRRPALLAGMLAGQVLCLGAYANAPSGPLEIGKLHQLSKAFLPGDRFMAATHRGALELANTKLDGFGAEGLSALAWDADEGILYAISDLGALLHLQPEWDGNNLRAVTLLATHALRNASGEALDGEWDDAEGLVLEHANDGVSGNSVLLVSFEGETRVDAYRPDGSYLDRRTLPTELNDKERFPGGNQGLEALTTLSDAGLVSGPQRPFTDSDRSFLHLYASAGQHWWFKPLDPDHSSLVALETLPDGRLLLLERRYISFFQAVLFAVRVVDPREAPAGGELAVTDLAIFDSSKGWRIDNFEGIAHHTGNRVFIVSDDNSNPIQKTLLLYLELDLGLDEPAAGKD